MPSIVGNALKVGKLGSQTTWINILRDIFQDGCILLNDTLRILSKNRYAIPTPLPLLGYTYQVPDRVELLKFSYSEYPYIDKKIITNAMVEEMTNFSVIGLKPIALEYPGNNVVVNFITNQVAYHVLKYYCKFGGTFTLITQWGIFNDLVLERLSGIKLPDAKTTGGEALLFEFKRVNFAKSLIGRLRDDMVMMMGGLV